MTELKVNRLEIEWEYYDKMQADVLKRIEKNVIDIAAVKEKVEILYTEKP